MPRGIALLAGAVLLGGLIGCRETLPGPPGFDGPPPGEGNATSLGDDYDSSTFRVIPFSVTGCDDAGDVGGTVHGVMPTITMWNDQKVAFVIVGRDPDQRWRFRPKANQEAFFNNGEPMDVTDPGNDAYFTSTPSAVASCHAFPYCTWEYAVIVKTLQDGSWEECAKLDPKIKIRDRTM